MSKVSSFSSTRQHVPPLKLDELIEDLKDGTALLALLEVLSGEKLPIERGRVLRRPHFLSNANTALQFLQSKRVRCRDVLCDYPSWIQLLLVVAYGEEYRLSEKQKVFMKLIAALQSMQHTVLL